MVSECRLSLRRRSLFCFAAWAVLVTWLWSVPSVSVGQEEAAPAAEATEEATEAPAEGGETGESEAKPAESQNALLWLIHTSGSIGAFLLVLSIYFVSLVTRLFMDFKQELATPPEILTQSEELIQKKDFMGLFKLLKSDESFFSRVLAAGLTELPHGLAEAREAMELTGEVETVNMEKRISMLAVLGSLGPMIGLLGTLKGMIASFSVIATSDTQLKASEVAGGISEALVLTFEGVSLSVPAIYFFAVFRNRVATISATTMLRADEYIRKIHALARSKGGAAAPSPAAPAAPTA